MPGSLTMWVDMRTARRLRWLKAGVKIIACSSDVAVLRNGDAAAVRRLRPDG